MQPMKFKRPFPKDPLARKLQEIYEYREMVIRAEVRIVTREAAQIDRIKYLSQFKEVIYEDIGLNFCNDESSNKSVWDVRNALKAISVTGISRIAFLKKNFGVARVSDNSLVQILAYMLNDKKLISHQKGESINDSILTESGQIFLVLLGEYIEKYIEENPLKKVSNNIVPAENHQRIWDEWDGTMYEEICHPDCYISADDTDFKEWDGKVY